MASDSEQQSSDKQWLHQKQKEQQVLLALKQKKQHFLEQQLLPSCQQQPNLQLQRLEQKIQKCQRLMLENQQLLQLMPKNQQQRFEQLLRQLHQQFQQLNENHQQLQQFEQHPQQSQHLEQHPQENQQFEQQLLQSKLKNQQLQQIKQETQQVVQQVLQNWNREELDFELQLQQLHNKIVMAYTIAVKIGMSAANQFKLILLGAEGGGKTSTVCSLIGKPFKPHQLSTVGADISNTCTVDRYCVSDWKLKELQEYLKDIPIQYKYELQKTMVEPTDSKPSEESLKEVDMTTVQDIMQNMMAPKGKIRIVIYDLGGQEVYYEIHFLFLASCDIVFIAFNASENLDAPVIRRQRFTISQKVYKTRKIQTNYEVIEATLHAIYSHCGMEGNKNSLSPRIPTVMLVGTHASNLTLEKKVMITKTLIERLSSKPLFDHVPRKRDDAVHFIDNKERDPEAFKRLKAVAIRAARPAINEERPVSYLKFEEEILEISQTVTEIKVERASDIAASAGLEDNPESLLRLLQYYNSKGILLYYPEAEGLKNLIFISPQKVSDLVSCVIKTHNYAEPMPSAALRKKFDRFDQFGILEESILDDILKRSGNVKNIVLAFLEKFDLAVEIHKDTKFENENDSYRTPDSGRVFFIPSMLVYNEGENYIKPEGHVDNVVLYYFPDEFLPETVFNHVLISTIKWCQKNNHHICRYVRSYLFYCIIIYGHLYFHM